MIISADNTAIGGGDNVELLFENTSEQTGSITVDNLKDYDFIVIKYRYTVNDPEYMGIIPTIDGAYNVGGYLSNNVDFPASTRINVSGDVISAEYWRASKYSSRWNNTGTTIVYQIYGIKTDVITV